MASTSNSRMVFVLGKEEHGNRTVHVVESGDEYSVDYAAVEVYTDQTARFPYVLN